MTWDGKVDNKDGWRISSEECLWLWLLENISADGTVESELRASALTIICLIGGEVKGRKVQWEFVTFCSRTWTPKRLSITAIWALASEIPFKFQQKHSNSKLKCASTYSQLKSKPTRRPSSASLSSTRDSARSYSMHTIYFRHFSHNSAAFRLSPEVAESFGGFCLFILLMKSSLFKI